MQHILCNSPARSDLHFIGAAYAREADHHLDHQGVLTSGQLWFGADRLSYGIAHCGHSGQHSSGFHVGSRSSNLILEVEMFFLLERLTARYRALLPGKKRNPPMRSSGDSLSCHKVAEYRLSHRLYSRRSGWQVQSGRRSTLALVNYDERGHGLWPWRRHGSATFGTTLAPTRPPPAGYDTHAQRLGRCEESGRGSVCSADSSSRATPACCRRRSAPHCAG